MTTIASSILALTGITAAIIRGRGVPESISGIAYILPHWVFSVWIALVGLLLMPGMMEVLPDDRRWMGFMVTAGLFCVASSSFYKTEAKCFHYIGGCTCAVFATIVTIILQPVLVALLGVFLLAMAAFEGKDWLFWTEAVIYVILVISILTQ